MWWYFFVTYLMEMYQSVLLWVLLLSAVYVLCCDYRGFSKAFRAPIAVFLTAGSMLVLWAALKRWAVVVWAPFFVVWGGRGCKRSFL